MNIHQEIDRLPHFKQPVITIGSFDGVHKGHHKILDQVLEEAQKVGGNSIVITFHPHPKNIVSPNKLNTALINTLEEKAYLLKRKGISDLVVIPFDKNFSEMSAEDFINEFLIKKFNPHSIIIGHDHRFGKNRSGNFEMLLNYARANNFSVIQIPEHVLKNLAISSTAIRNHIGEGDMVSANQLLGYTFFFSGKVIAGNKRGRLIGFPTANLEITNDNKLIPGDGVYAVYVDIEGAHQQLKGMMNIGYNPTFNEKIKKIEVHIFDFNEDVYEKKVTIYVTQKIREVISFSGSEALQNQLKKDKEIASACLS